MKNLSAYLQLLSTSKKQLSAFANAALTAHKVVESTRGVSLGNEVSRPKHRFPARYVCRNATATSSATPQRPEIH